MDRGGVLFGVVLVGLLLVGCDRRSAPDIEYAHPYEAEDFSTMDLEKMDAYRSKVDFARLEHEHPLKPADLRRITFTPNNLKFATQEQVDQIYARLTAGPIPDGPFEIDLWLPRGRRGDTRIAEIAGGGLRGLSAKLLTAKLELVTNKVWKGKLFEKRHADSRTKVAQPIARTSIHDSPLLRTALSKLLSKEVSEIPKTTVSGREERWAFPAKVYCGQSLLDGRRESIIIDYAFSREIDGYREESDWLAGPDGLQLRNEIRLVRPGFYLGRVYMGRVFVLNFILYNETIAKQETDAFLRTGRVEEDCWIGSQRLAAVKQ